ncbi:MAG: 16S rRNA (uracil(1498)-N(3))-methyltransferase [Lachnospiraceae bacterium]|nr:16S rRNA (uracil(1498)-N(3))-methyltransferase [Lachnospiraceae bacterium]MBQ9610079.1 16S rRNA (uracil(1498)-N(3))-methyltransferase [Lachnospiraceae bacterium]
MPRFYVDKSICINAEKSITITGEDVNHIKNVLRLKSGESITVSDGGGTDYICRISGISQDSVVADIEDVVKNASELKVKITLFQGMPKSDKPELIIQKAVELGVYEVVPVMTKRTIVKLDDKKAAKKLERYNAIAKSAAEQSGRGIVPSVKDFMSFKEALEYAKSLDMNIIPYEEARGMEYSREVVRSIRNVRSLGIFIGPEGGFAKEEVEAAEAMGAKCITLGNRILRTETAGLTTLSIIMFEIDE